MSILHVAICGNVLPEARDEDNPCIYLRDERTQEAVMYVARHFPKRDELCRRFADIAPRIDNLFRTGVLREEEHSVFLNFTLFTREDHLILYDVAGRWGYNLARAICGREHELRDLLAMYHTTGASLEKVAFIAIGFLLLDWRSLEKLTQWGYMCRAKQQTGGTFTVNAEEAIDLDLRAVYWGGHSDVYDGLVFVSFGAHACQRIAAFPDILWNEPFTVKAPFDCPEARGVLSAYLGTLKRDLAQALRFFAGEQVSVSAPVEACKRWLERLGYAQNGTLTVPYFDEEDRAWLEPLSQMVLGEVRTWLEEHYSKLKQALAQSTPVRHGVDYTEVFRVVWHWVFGMANRSLAQMGIIYDTYQSGSLTPGYLPAVIKQELFGSRFEPDN